jgi:hypothetical protein
MRGTSGSLAGKTVPVCSVGAGGRVLSRLGLGTTRTYRLPRPGGTPAQARHMTSEGCLHRGTKSVAPGDRETLRGLRLLQGSA